MLLGVHGFDADVQLLGHDFRGQTLTEVELNEGAIFVGEVREQLADQAGSLAHQRALARVGQAGGQFLGFAQSGTAGFTAPGQINWFTNGTDTFIQLNTNADPTVDGIIQVLGVHTVDASWFSL